jgi:hypothetical protein
MILFPGSISVRISLNTRAAIFPDLMAEGLGPLGTESPNTKNQ